MPRVRRLVRAAGIEPDTSCLEDRHAAHYATPAGMNDGGEYRDRTCASVRTRRVSTALPYRSANSPNSGGDGALGGTRTSMGLFRTRLTVQLVHERMVWRPRPVLPRLMAVLQTAAFLFRHRAKLAARTGAEPVWTRVRRLAGRPARDNGQRGWIRTTDPLLPRQVGTARLPYALMMIGLPGRTRTCIPSRS